MKNASAAAVLVVLTLTLPRAAGAQCVIFEDPAEFFAISDTVFLGTVTSTRPTGNSGFHVTTHIATFRLERSWKGRRDPQVQVGVDAPVDVGNRYVVFAGGKPLSASVECDGVMPVERATRKLTWLHTKPSRTVRQPASRSDGGPH